MQMKNSLDLVWKQDSRLEMYSSWSGFMLSVKSSIARVDLDRSICRSDLDLCCVSFVSLSQERESVNTRQELPSEELASDFGLDMNWSTSCILNSVVECIAPNHNERQLCRSRQWLYHICSGIEATRAHRVYVKWIASRLGGGCFWQAVSTSNGLEPKSEQGNKKNEQARNSDRTVVVSLVQRLCDDWQFFWNHV